MESSERIDEEVIAERFEFNEDDIVIFEEKSVEITMNTEDNTMIEFEKILQIANEITDTSLTT
jgi:hypothetical protein